VLCGTYSHDYVQASDRPVSEKSVAAPVAVKAALGELVRADAASPGGACGAWFRRRPFYLLHALCRQALTRVSLMVTVVSQGHADED